MANFAVIDNSIVVNIIVADSKEIAESLTELECVLVEDSRQDYPQIGLSYVDGVFEQQPVNKYELLYFPSWTWDENLNKWIPPIPEPDSGFWLWDELNGEWKEEDLIQTPPSN
jgi:hypothetical protein